MADTKFTPGPWEAHTGLDYTVIMLPGETTDGASIQVFGENATELAAMIAAAPELYAAVEELKALFDQHAQHDERCGPPECTCGFGAARRRSNDIVDAALAKARGEQ